MIQKAQQLALAQFPMLISEKEKVVVYLYLDAMNMLVTDHFHAIIRLQNVPFQYIFEM